MSVLRFCSFIHKICGFDSKNYTAIERILAMDTGSEEPTIQAAQDYSQNTESLLRRGEGYTVKYTPSAQGVTEGVARGNS